MKKTTVSNLNVSQKILINTEELQSLLSCGRVSAVKIVGIGKRVLWNKDKVKKYVDKISI